MSTAGMPDLLYGEAEEELRAAVRSLLHDRAGWPSVLARTETDEPYDIALWQVLAADVGCAGLLIPDKHGGAGASYREAAVVAEEVGRSVAPVPYLGSAVVATAALLDAADDDLLSGLAGGTVTAALAVPFAAAPPVAGQPVAGQPVAWPSGSWLSGDGPLAGVRVAAPRSGDPAGQTRLRGTMAAVADALPADVLLVPADGVPAGLYAVDARAAGLTVTPVTSLDSTRMLADLALDDVPARCVASGEAATRAVAAALTAGAAMLAAEQLGVAERCLDMTVGYLKERHQFARPVGSFQALKHRLADMWVAITQARSASRYAAACLASGDPDTPVAVALAKAACSEAALHAAQECVQMHGGIGFTWEHPAHLYLKRAKSSSIGFGTPDWHLSTLADLAGLPAAGR